VPPTQTDLCRAISSAYYALFHEVARVSADLMVGAINSASIPYVQFYRSLEHKHIRKLCETICSSGSWAPAYVPYMRTHRSPSIIGFATAFRTLYEKRHRADYDPSFVASDADVRAVISTAQSALDDFRMAPDIDRKAFLVMLFTQPRTD